MAKSQRKSADAESGRTVKVSVPLGVRDHARLCGVAALRGMTVSAFAAEAITFDYVTLQRDAKNAAQEQLVAFSARHPIEAALLTTAVVAGPPAREIVQYAKEHAIDLIVLGTHGHGFIDRLLIGSVAERVARQAPSAVLMVPHVTRRLTSFEAKAAASVDA